MRIIVLAALLLAACASSEVSMRPGANASYRDLGIKSTLKAMASNPAPDAVKQRFAECMADYTARFFTPEERAELDAYARGDHSIPAAEMARLDASFKQRSGNLDMSARELDRLNDTCPQDVPAFKQYRLPRP